MGRDVPLTVESVDTNTLDSTPGHAAIALANGRNGGTETDALCIKTPVAELSWTLGNHQETLEMAPQPEVAMTVGNQGADFGRRRVDTKGVDVEPLKASGMIVGQTEDTLSARTYI